MEKRKLTRAEYQAIGDTFSKSITIVKKAAAMTYVETQNAEISDAINKLNEFAPFIMLTSNPDLVEIIDDTTNTNENNTQNDGTDN